MTDYSGGPDNATGHPWISKEEIRSHGKPQLSQFAGIAALSVAVVIWGASFPIIQAGIGSLPINLFLFFRFTLGGIVVACITFIHGWQQKAWLNVGPWILGIILYGSFATQTEGLTLTTPARSAFLTSLSVVMVPVIVCIQHRRMLPRSIWTAVAIFLLGLVILYYNGLRHLGVGDGLSILCALGFAVYLVLAQSLVSELDVINVTAIQTCAVAAIAGTAALAQGDFHAVALSESSLLAIGYSGIFATVLAFGAQLLAQTKIHATSAALILSLEPVIAAVLSVAIGRDQGSWQLAVGGILMFAGAAIGQIRPTGETE